MGRMDGKVVLITGAARGQGRAHAVRLAEEGADIIALDLCEQVGTVPYALAKSEDLAQTAKSVEQLDRRIIARQADVRSSEQLDAVVQAGLAEFGHIDVVVANAGIVSFGSFLDITDEQLDDMLDVNVKGVWRTIRAVLPSMIEAGAGGSIVITSSASGVVGLPNLAHYTAAKHAVVGLMKTLVNEVSQHRIRVNTVQPTSVDTDMIQNDTVRSLFRPDLKTVSCEEFAEAWHTINALPVPWVETSDVSHAVVYLASDESRYVTGLQLRVDAGAVEKK